LKKGEGKGCEEGAKEKERDEDCDAQRDIYYADLEPVKGSQHGKTRPVLMIQTDAGNERSPVTIIACITPNLARLPTNVAF
jgi:mRNA-degrading endonuclease toxin of MazEF toxin-antitoxin module